MPLPQDVSAGAPAASVQRPTQRYASALGVRFVSARLKHRLKPVQIHFAAVFFILQALPGLDPLQLLSRHICRQRPRLLGAVHPRMAFTPPPKNQPTDLPRPLPRGARTVT